jgi:gamma-glutamylputrescine oxidase
MSEALPTWYHATAEPLPPFPRLEYDVAADVVVIGGGLTGIAASLVLAERGVSVVLLEAGRIGDGASGRNGGQFHSGQRRDQWELEKLVGPDDAKRLWTLAEDAKIWLRARIRRHGIDCDFRTGLVHADHKRRYVRTSRAYVEHLRDFYNYPHVEFLDRERLQNYVKSDGYFGGYLDRDGGQLHPVKLVRGLARAAEKAKARIHEHSRVTAFHGGETINVRTATGSVQASFAIIATDEAIPGLRPSAAPRVMPIASTIAVTEPLGKRLDELLPGRMAVSDSRFVVNYFRGVAGGRLLFGGGESYSMQPVADPASLVRKAMAEVFPEIAEVPFAAAWGGLVGITPTRLPFVRRLRPNVLVAAGYSGQGLLLAPYFGSIVAETLRGGNGRFELLARLPVPEFPGGPRARHPLLFAAMSWYALRDRI